MIATLASMNPVPRTIRALGYFCIAGSGVGITVIDIFGPFYKVMGLWCVIGGLLSFLGTASGRWAGEYIGLPLVGSAMIAFAALTYRDTWDAAHWVAVPSILLLMGYGILLAARWADVSAVARAAKEYARGRSC